MHGATRMAHRRAGVQGCRGAWRTGAQVHMRTGAQVPIKIEHRLKKMVVVVGAFSEALSEASIEALRSR